MEKEIVLIKNMVCHRCIITVESILANLNISFVKVNLGEVVVQSNLSQEQTELLQNELKKIGFEIIAEKHEGISNKIKSVIIQGIFEDKNFSNKNLSAVLSEE